MTGQAPRLVFRFTQVEVDKMVEVLRDLNAVPKRPVVQGITDEFNSSTDRSGDGKVPVQYNQVRNWCQNRRSAQSQQDRTTMGASPPPQGKMMLPTVAEEHNPVAGSYSGNISSDGGQVQFEAKSARNGQWYDVAAFLSHRPTETRDPEVLVRFTWLGPEEDEWADVCKCVRVRSLQCVDVLPGDHILCFKEGKEQDLYFDAHVLQVQRRRHDVRGCRCRFLVCYDHDHSEEVVPLRNVCRQPEHQKAQQPQKMIDVNTDKETGGGVPIPPDQGGPSDKPIAPSLDAPSSTHRNSVADVEVGNAEAAPNGEVTNEAHGDKMNVAESSFASLCIAL